MRLPSVPERGARKGLIPMDRSSTNAGQFINAATTLQPAICEWQNYLAEQNKSEYTIKAFIGDIKLMASYFSPDMTIGSVTTKDIQNFLNWMNNERAVPCSPKTYSRRITSIKLFFKWLYKFGAIDADPAAAVEQKAVKSPLPEILTKTEYDKVLEAANAQRTKARPDARNMTLLQLLLSTGIKKGEALAIDRNHIEREDPEHPVLNVRYANANSAAKERRLDLPASWLPVYDEYLEQYKPATAIFPWSPRRLEYLLEDIGEAAGLTKHLSFAMCRWTCFVKNYAEGMSADEIRRRMGVSNVQWRETFNKIKVLVKTYNEE